jgi:hypothetical protein
MCCAFSRSCALSRRHTHYLIFVALQGDHALASIHVPQPQCVVIRPRAQQVAARGEHDARGLAQVPSQNLVVAPDSAPSQHLAIFYRRHKVPLGCVDRHQRARVALHSQLPLHFHCTPNHTALVALVTARHCLPKPLLPDAHTALGEFDCTTAVSTRGKAAAACLLAVAHAPAQHAD